MTPDLLRRMMPLLGQDKSESAQPSGGDLLRIEVPSRLSERYWAKATRYHFWYSVIGLAIGALSLSLGVTLLFHGIIGRTNWTASVLGVHSELSDAASGVVFGVIGLLIVAVTKYQIKLRSK
jgi:hypothetical protein